VFAQEGAGPDIGYGGWGLVYLLVAVAVFAVGALIVSWIKERIADRRKRREGGSRPGGLS
jgi:hypothetical protein